MKKYIFIILSVLLLGCDKMEDNVFSENPDDRLQKTEEEYRQTILAAPNGWFLAIQRKRVLIVFGCLLQKKEKWPCWLIWTLLIAV